MAVEMLLEYDRERLALYLAGLLPNDQVEAQAVLDLTSRLLPVLRESRDQHAPKDYQRDDDQRDG